ncbi:MAG: hypothetical protein AAB903_00140 [Patescibacteria group bacterium]
MAMGRLVRHLWRRGDAILRLVLAFIFGWPLVVGVLGMMAAPHLSNPRMANGIIGILPVILAFVIMLNGRFSPVLIAAASQIPEGKKALQYLVLIFALELLFGIYFAVVPTWNDIGLIPVTILLGVAIMVLWISQLPAGRFIAKGLLGVLGIITLIFFLGGTEKITRKDPPPAAPSGGTPIRMTMPASMVLRTNICSTEDDSEPLSDIRLASHGDIEIWPGEKGCWTPWVYNALVPTTTFSTGPVLVQRGYQDRTFENYVEDPSRPGPPAKKPTLKFRFQLEGSRPVIFSFR